MYLWFYIWISLVHNISDFIGVIKYFSSLDPIRLKHKEDDSSLISFSLRKYMNPYKEFGIFFHFILSFE